MSRVQLSGAEAMELLQRGEDAAEVQDWPVVAACYEEFLTAFPDTPISAELWFDAALANKFLRNWPKAYELGRQAALRAGEPEGNPAWWNLGIAATMVGDWGTAREAWTNYGVPLHPGEGEIEDGFGTALVRLDPDGDAEVVWVRRICPTRARVLSVPYGERRFGEIVVHDGAPTGERRVDGHTFAVFDELALWQASTTSTWRAQVTAPDPVGHDRPGRRLRRPRAGDGAGGQPHVPLLLLQPRLAGGERHGAGRRARRAAGGARRADRHGDPHGLGRGRFGAGMARDPREGGIQSVRRGVILKRTLRYGVYSRIRRFATQIREAP